MFMKITQYSAISIDGFIAKSNFDAEWISEEDWKIFTQILKQKRVVVMGSKTMEMSGEDFPYDCELNIVATSQKELHKKTTKQILYTDKSPKEIAKEVEKRGFDELLVIGGGKMNASFLEADLIDEIILSIQPIILGQGIKIFNTKSIESKLELINIRKVTDNLVQAIYKIKK